MTTDGGRSPAGDGSLLDKIGGRQGAREAVHDLYLRLRRRPHLAAYFEGRSVEDVEQKFGALIIQLLVATDHDVSDGVLVRVGAAHHGLGPDRQGVHDADYDETVSLLVDVLVGRRVPDDVLNALGRAAARFKPYIVDNGAATGPATPAEHEPAAGGSGYVVADGTDVGHTHR